MECTCLVNLNHELNYDDHPAILRDPWCPKHGDSSGGSDSYNLGDVYDKLFRRPNHDRG